MALLRHYRQDDGSEYVVIVVDEEQVNDMCRDDHIEGEFELPPFPGGYVTWPTNRPLYPNS